MMLISHLTFRVSLLLFSWPLNSAHQTQRRLLRATKENETKHRARQCDKLIIYLFRTARPTTRTSLKKKLCSRKLEPWNRLSLIDLICVLYKIGPCPVLRQEC